MQVHELQHRPEAPGGGHLAVRVRLLKREPGEKPETPDDVNAVSVSFEYGPDSPTVGAKWAKRESAGLRVVDWDGSISSLLECLEEAAKLLRSHGYLTWADMNKRDSEKHKRERYETLPDETREQEA